MLDACFDNPNELLCTKDGRIYVELYCSWIYKAENENLIEYADSFEYRNDFTDASTDDDFRREIVNVRDRTAGTNKFSIYRAQYSKRAACIIGCPIPTVCEDNRTLGAIVIAANLCDDRCSNIEEVLTIFARVAANSISKYNECVTSRFEKAVAEPHSAKE
jgi:hypothetical protein